MKSEPRNTTSRICLGLDERSAMTTPQKNIIRDLLVKRNKVDANTPIHHVLSNLIRQMQKYQDEEDPVARANLEWSMDWQMKMIERTAS